MTVHVHNITVFLVHNVLLHAYCMSFLIVFITYQFILIVFYCYMLF